MSGGAAQPYAQPAGLCETCANVRIVDTKKGSRFFMCRLSETDPRFPKYPSTPVLRCSGYVPAEAGAVEVVAEEGG